MEKIIIFIGMIGLIMFAGCNKYDYEERYNQCIQDNVNRFNLQKEAEEKYSEMVVGCMPEPEVEKETCTVWNKNDGLRMRGTYSTINDSVLHGESCCCIDTDLKKEFLCYCDIEGLRK